MRIAQFRTKSFAKPIAIHHDSKSELAFNEEDVYVVQSKIRGYHIYKEASIGDRLSCEKEEYNVHDPYCVGVIDHGNVTVGHVP